MSGFQVIRQTSLSTERYSKDGQEVNMHYVLKDKPFIIELGLTKPGNSVASVDFKSILLDVNLYFDSGKQVDSIKVKPFSYKSTINQAGNLATIECVIHILSSQNEGSLFKLRIKGLSSTTSGHSQPIEGLQLETEPLTVISKPSVLKKKLEREKAKVNAVKSATPLTVSTLNVPTTPAVAATPSTPSVCGKRPRDDQIFSTLAQIQKQQQEQHRMIEEMHHFWKYNPHLPSPSSTTSPSASPSHGSDLGGTPSSYLLTEEGSSSSQEAPEIEFEQALKCLVNSFHSIDPNERPLKVRKALESVSPQILFPVIDVIYSENFQRELETNLPSNSIALSSSMTQAFEDPCSEGPSSYTKKGTSLPPQSSVKPST